MNKKIGIFLSLFLLVWVYYFSFKKVSSGQPGLAQQKQAWSQDSDLEDLGLAEDDLPADVKEEVKRLNQEVILESMIELLSLQVLKERGFKALIGELEKRRLRPLVVKDFNSETGTMYIVRTENRHPGIRYFHAQYVDDSFSRPLLQHISFEVKPSANAREQVVQMIQQKFVDLGEPVFQNPTFTAWHVSSDYYLGVKIMDEIDLVSDEYNAYTTEDMGTIKVSMEWEVHSENDLAHSH